MEINDVIEHRAIELDVTAARHIVEVLELLAELPSTPAIAAEGARHHVGLIEAQLPTPHSPQEWDRERPPVTTISLDQDATSAIIELLDLFAQMPSTPPAMATDAQQLAVTIRLRRDDD